ncbi:MAG TPA: class II aldolase/adducin family protein [Mycobacteriales bacterium]|nr:class II aldolase/adducin family protein [Mycobacteriales bacterium]
MLDSERARLADAGRELAAERLVLGTAGNLSARVGGHLLVSPTGVRLGDLRAEDVAIVNLSGQVLDGPRPPTSELAMHLALYERADVAAVVHTHAPLGVAVSCVVDELPCLHYQMLTFGGPVRVAPYATFGSAALAESVRGAMHERTAALMANHGSVTVGRDLRTALERTVLLEWACAVYCRASALGQPRSLGPDEIAAVAAAAKELDYPGLLGD